MEHNFESYYLEVMSYPKEELKELAKKSMYFLHNQIKKQLTDIDERMKLILVLVESYMIVDGPISDEERDLYKYMLEYMDDIPELNQMCINSFNDLDKYNTLLNVLKKNDEDIRDGLFMLGATIAAIDGEINIKEQEFIENLSRISITK